MLRACLATLAVSALTVLSAVFAFACGSTDDSGTQRNARLAAPEPSLAASAQGRTVVATVGDHPVYGDCVTRQASAHALDRQAALQECIDFELLAQAADAKGYRNHPDVLERRKNEAIRAYIDTEFADHYASPDDIPMATVRQAYDQLKAQHWVHDELRTMQYVRLKLDKNAVGGGPQELVAGVIAGAIYERLKDRTDVTGDELQDAARHSAGSTRYQYTSPMTFSMASNIVPQVKRIVFETLHTVGTVSPPERTRWGWDVVLLVEIRPAENVAFAEAETEVREIIFKTARQRAFAAFLKNIDPGSSEVSDYWLERLARAAQAEAAPFEVGQP